MRIFPFALAAALAVGFVPAQQNVVYYPGQTLSSTNAFPFGSEGVRYQSIIPGSLFNNSVAVINDIFARGNTTKSLSVTYEDIEIRMGVTPVAAPTSDWNTNNPNPTTVYRGPMVIDFTANTWSGIGLPKSYLFIPTAATDNLCFEVIVWSAKTMTGSGTNFYFPGADSSVRRAYLYQWTSNQTNPARTGASGAGLGFLLGNGNFVTAGRGCRSSNSTELRISGTTQPKPSTPFTISLTGQPTTVSILALGLQFTPVDLGILGAPGCKLWCSPQVTAARVTDLAGLASLTATLGANTTSGTVYAQWYQLDSGANAAGLTSSNFGTIILGL